MTATTTLSSNLRSKICIANPKSFVDWYGESFFLSTSGFTCFIHRHFNSIPKKKWLQNQQITTEQNQEPAFCEAKYLDTYLFILF